MSMQLVAVSMVVLLALAGVAEARGSGRGGGKSGGVALRTKGIVGSVPLAFTRSVPATPGLVSPLLRPSTAGAIVAPRALTTGIVPPGRVRNASRVVAFTDSAAVVSSTTCKSRDHRYEHRARRRFRDRWVKQPFVTNEPRKNRGLRR